MTLIDTVGGFAATLEVLGAELGITFPTDAMTSRLGPPLGHLLRDHMPEDQVSPATSRSTWTTSRARSGAPARATCSGHRARASTWATTCTTSRERWRPGPP